LFLILIADIDKDITSSFLSRFADDTRVGAAIATTDDASKLQEDLHTVYNWAEQNNMEFNATKFELLRYGNNAELKQSTQYTSNVGTIIEEKPQTSGQSWKARCQTSCPTEPT
jgi:hypothetical protein